LKGALWRRKKKELRVGRGLKTVKRTAGGRRPKKRDKRRLKGFEGLGPKRASVAYERRSTTRGRGGRTKKTNSSYRNSKGVKCGQSKINFLLGNWSLLIPGSELGKGCKRRKDQAGAGKRPYKRTQSAPKDQSV